MATTLPRITARVDIATQDLLSKAAAIVGMPSINAFVVSAAVEKANQVVEREQTLKLSERDATLLMAVLDKSATASPNLQAAFARHDSNS